MSEPINIELLGGPWDGLQMKESRDRVCVPRNITKQDGTFLRRVDDLYKRCSKRPAFFRWVSPVECCGVA